jgi:hypothetical protein
MKPNVGTVDRLIRVLVAVLVAVLVGMGMLSGVWAWVAGIAAGVLLLTGGAAFCPAYTLFGIRTCPLKK